jgi:hypothetical protein
VIGEQSDTAGSALQQAEGEGNAEAATSTPEERTARLQANYDRALQQFQAQPLDNTWASKTAADLEAILSSRFPQNLERGPVECRQTWCSFEVRYPADSNPGALAMKQIKLDLAKRGPVPSVAFLVVDDANGTTTGRYYFRYKRD